MTQGFCDKYEKLIRNFWWGEENGQRKVHWMSWERMIKPKRGGGIDFRDMKLFNQALLARQAWRLIQRPDSLCARVLKSKYYPNGELLDTVFASDASPVWRGIEHGLELLKAGLVWRIGNGRKVNIQRDRWIPRESGLKPANFIRRSRLRWVNQLMLADGSGWNSELIHQLFYGFDADAICSIRIPNSAAEDTLAWNYEKSGVFTVRSAYKLAASLQDQAEGAASSSTNASHNRSMWDIIWKAKVPEKIKIFGWRTATNTLPTKLNKWKRTLDMDSTCNICGMGEENEHHAVVSCTKSRALRTEMRKVWNIPSETLFQFTGEDWLQNLLGPCNMETRTKVLLLLWRCWFLRDDYIHSTGKELVSRSALFLQQYVEEIIDNSYVSNSDMKDKQGLGQLRNASVGKESAGGAMEVLRSGCNLASSGAWCPPSNGLVKLNTDASFLADSGQTCIGAVARDHRGLVFFSQSKSIECCSSVEEAEARALLLGLQSLAALFRGPIIAETDCSFLAKEIQSDASNRSACFSVIHDAKNELSKFRDARVDYVNRNQNKLAHCLAARARKKGDAYKVAGVPDDLVEEMRADMASAQE